LEGFYKYLSIKDRTPSLYVSSRFRSSNLKNIGSECTLINSRGPRTLPWGTPHKIVFSLEKNTIYTYILSPIDEVVLKPGVSYIFRIFPM